MLQKRKLFLPISMVPLNTFYIFELIIEQLLDAQQTATPNDQRVVYLSVSRTAVGSSARFVCSLIATLLNLQQDIKEFQPESNQKTLSDRHYQEMQRQPSQESQYKFYQYIQGLKYLPPI